MRGHSKDSIYGKLVGTNDESQGAHTVTVLSGELDSPTQRPIASAVLGVWSTELRSPRSGRRFRGRRLDHVGRDPIERGGDDLPCRQLRGGALGGNENL